MINRERSIFIDQIDGIWQLLKVLRNSGHHTTVHLYGDQIDTVLGKIYRALGFYHEIKFVNSSVLSMEERTAADSLGLSLIEALYRDLKRKKKVPFEIVSALYQSQKIENALNNNQSSQKLLPM